MNVVEVVLLDPFDFRLVLRHPDTQILEEVATQIAVKNRGATFSHKSRQSTLFGVLTHGAPGLENEAGDLVLVCNLCYERE